MSCQPKPVVVDCVFDDDEVFLIREFVQQNINNPLTTLNVNLKNLCIGSENIIEFSSNILAAARDEETAAQSNRVSIEFELKRQCLGEEDEETLETWVFTRHLPATGYSTEDTFTFNFCDNNFCCDCCRYWVEVSFNGTPGNQVRTLRIKNVSLSAVAQ